MATIEARGYVSKPESKTYGEGKTFSKFVLGVKQKAKDGTVTWGNYFVTDWNNGSPPANKAYVTVKGYLTVKESEKDGNKRTFLEVKATDVEVAPPLDGTAGQASAAPGTEKDPWD